MKKWGLIILMIIAFLFVLLGICFFYSICPPIQINFINKSAFCQTILNSNYFINENYTLLRGPPTFVEDSLNTTYLEIIPDKVLNSENLDRKKYGVCDQTYCYGQPKILCKPSMKEPVKINCRFQSDKPGYIGGWFRVVVFVCQNEGVYFINYYGSKGKQFVGPFNLTTNQYVFGN